MGSKAPKRPEIRKRLVAGRKYHLLHFDSGEHTITFGTLSKNTSGGDSKTQYVFTGESGLYRLFHKDDIRKSKTGQAVRKGIRNGRLEFMAFFETEEEAIEAANRLPKKVASLLIRESIERDKQAIMKVKGSVMDRISVFKDVLSSKSVSELSSILKKLNDC